MTRNISRRLAQLEDSLLPVLEEPMVIHIIAVDGDGQRKDTGIKLRVRQVPKPLKTGR